MADNLSLFGIFTSMGVGMSIPYLLLAIKPEWLGFMPKPGRWMLVLRRILAGMLLITSLWLVSLLAGHFLPGEQNPEVQSSGEKVSWQMLDETQISKLVASGKTVFVDITADWCMTCKANKFGVIERNPVSDALNAENVVRMQGDWTMPSDDISNFLQKHRRFGVPFNIVYGPDAPEGIPLPVILDSTTLINALEKAG